MKRAGIAVAAALLLIALPLSSQESAGTPEFQQALQEVLKNEDWSREQIEELIKKEVYWNQAGPQDFELVPICLQYVKETHEGIGPEVQARIAVEVMMMARQMRGFGFGEQQIIRAALNGTREALFELAKLQETERVRTGYDTGIGQMIRSQFEEQLHAAMYLQARHKVKTRVQDEKASRPDDLLVPPGPQGPRVPGR
jgi:hypothetical protein